MKAGAATPQRGSWGEGGAAKEAREPDKEGEPSPHAALSLGSHGLDFFDREIDIEYLFPRSEKAQQN